MFYIVVDELGTIQDCTEENVWCAGIEIDDETYSFETVVAAQRDYKFIDSHLVYTPAPSTYYDWDGQNWILNSSLLEYDRKTCVTKIHEYRDELCLKVGVQVAGHWWFTDANDRTRYLGIIMASSLASAMGAPQPAPSTWHTMDGVYVALTTMMTVGIMQAIAASDTAIFTNAIIHITNVNSSPDPLNYNYMTGWPAVYGE